MNINGRLVSSESKPIFIADIAANHDGSLSRAIRLIELAAESGADAVKFQHFAAETIVSDKGFIDLGSQLSHQSKWKKSVFETYAEASIDESWTSKLADAARNNSVEFMSTPYSTYFVDHLEPYVSVFKIGSGDITNIEVLRRIAETRKPWILASGAATLDEVRQAVGVLMEGNRDGVLMQCNTNYTGDLDNAKYLNLRVLRSYRRSFPELVLGLSDHTHGHDSVIAAQALGASVFEKHFTDDNNRQGPDHAFSMTPTSWRAMVDSANLSHDSLGDGVKRIEANELETVIVQRRALRFSRPLKAGHVISPQDLVSLRPCPSDALSPFLATDVIGRTLSKDVSEGEHLRWSILG